MDLWELRQRVRERPVAVAAAAVVIAIAGGWWFTRGVDGASLVAKVNAKYTSFAGYEADISLASTGAPLQTLLHRRPCWLRAA